jgi:hypothetical protein
MGAGLGWRQEAALLAGTEITYRCTDFCGGGGGGGGVANTHYSHYTPYSPAH